ncbi:MAG: hypothetical protein R3F54_07610 [Alphaproteobacteria bacterium]
MDVDKETPGQAAQAPFVAAGQAASQPPDLSTMTPREAADRLFNRVMMANEQGNGDEAMRFAPMAIQAYDLLGTLDLDALYHVGRLQETIGDLEAAEAVIGDMRKTAPDHLLAILLEHDVAVQRGDEARAGEAAAAFLDAYDRELAQGRGEYGDHSASLEMFLAEARDEVKRQE